MQSPYSPGLVFGLLLSLLAGAISVCAQQTPPPSASPKPAARSLPPISDAQDESVQTPQGNMLPDTTPVTGILVPTLGTPQLEHSFVMVGAQIGNTVQSGGVVNSGWYSNQYFAGTLSLVKYWRRGITSVNYSGGGYTSINNQQGSGSYQTFSFSQTAHAGRWDFSFVDVPQYLPESRFGFGGGTSLGNPGTGGLLPILVPGINGGPNQDILSAVGARFSNSAAAQATYVLSERDSVTFTGSYGLLRFMDSSNFDSDTFGGGIGYNRQITKLDSLGVVYSFSGYHFTGSPQAYGSHSIGLSFGRKITGRMALQLSAGPQITTYRIPVGASSSSVSAYANANLSYSLRDGSLNLNYRHGLSNGSGVLVGSQIDQVSANVSRRLGRVWNGFANLGYSRNASIGGLPESNNQTYDDWFLGVGAGRPFGRNINFSAAYSVTFEKAQQPGCSSGSCNTDFTQHMITLSLQWHTRPFVLH